jgi:hypothetical protein
LQLVYVMIIGCLPKRRFAACSLKNEGFREAAKGRPAPVNSGPKWFSKLILDVDFSKLIGCGEFGEVQPC